MFKKAVLVNISDAAIGQGYWDQLDGLVENRILIQRDDPNLKYIGVLATAYGTIDIEYAASKGIPVSNLGGYSNESVAEFTLAALLTSMRNVIEGLRRAQRNEFDESGIRARELRGSQFGVVGLGSIGNRVAELASGFGAHVSYWSREPKESAFTYKQLIDLVKESDFISINVAETPETKGILSAEVLQNVKDDAVIVMTVPLSVIDLDALKEMLDRTHVTFISDHGDELSQDELKQYEKYGDRVVFLPAIAYIIDEAKEARQSTFVANIKAALSGVPANKVN
jgi:lactate dehydrogenase-like 2-hydroxyacid dehydrogenase